MIVTVWAAILGIISAHSKSFIMRNGLSSSSSSQHRVGPLVDQFQAHKSGNLYNVPSGFFCPMFCSIVVNFVFSVIYYGAFCLYFANNFFCIPVLCPKLGLYLLLLQSLSLRTGMKIFSSEPSTNIPKGDMCGFCRLRWTITLYIRPETISSTWGTAFDNVWLQGFAITDTFSF
jgi:hypothetical protein